MRTAARHSVVVLVLTALLAAGCSASASPTPHPEAADFCHRRTDLPIDNFAQVAEGVYRGAQPDEAGFAALRDLGVRTVVNLRQAHSDRSMAEKVGIKVVTLPMHALVDSDPPSDEDVETFLKVVTDPAQRPVFFHCAVGKDRTGTMCAVYRMEVQGWQPDKALAEMRSMGFHENYRDLSEYVRCYEPRANAAK